MEHSGNRCVQQAGAMERFADAHFGVAPFKRKHKPIFELDAGEIAGCFACELGAIRNQMPGTTRFATGDNQWCVLDAGFAKGDVWRGRWWPDAFARCRLPVPALSRGPLAGKISRPPAAQRHRVEVVNYVHSVIEPDRESSRDKFR